MKQHSDKLQQWWRERESREQWMLTTMLAAITAFALWYGAFTPLRHWRDASLGRHERAAIDLAQVQLELARLQPLRQGPQAPADAASLKQAVLDAASASGLAISRQREEEAGFGIEADAATPAQLFTWLDTLRQQHGLAPSRLSVAKSEGRLRLQAGFDGAR